EMIFEKLNKIFQDLFDDESLHIDENTTAADIEDWDSLVHIHLLIDVENEFGIKFSMNEASSLKNVGMMADVIYNKLN
ncbi:MAG: acyl carrier protein, partial [Oscillospiraceae bacterium]